MSDFLSALIAAAYSAVMSLGALASGSTDAEVKARKVGVSEVRMEARNAFKRAENKANVDYQSAIVDCKKKPSAEKRVCLEEAKAANDHAITDAKMTSERLVAEAQAAEISAEIETRASNGMPAAPVEVANR